MTVYDVVQISLSNKESDAISALVTDDENEAFANGSLIGFGLVIEARRRLCDLKLPTLLELVEGEDRPVVVASVFRSGAEAFAGRDGWAVITGASTPKARSEAARRFNAGGLRGVAFTIRAGGVGGLSFSRAERLIFVDREIVPALNTQAELRVLRADRTRALQVTDLIADHPLEAAVRARLRRAATHHAMTRPS